MAKGAPIIPLSSDIFVTTKDLDQMKLMFLVFAASSLLSLIKFLWDLITKKEEKERQRNADRLDSLEATQGEILKTLQKLEINLSHISNLDADEVRDIARQEVIYARKIQKQ